MADAPRSGMRSLTESHVSSRDLPRQPGTRSWPRRRVIWSCDASKGPLLTRYYLVDCRWFGLYVHQLHTSDLDGALHDHPWSFLTWLVSSGYWEHGPNGRWWRRRFSVLYRRAEWMHRLELATRPTWTLVLRFPRRRDWGFWLADGTWLDWRNYGKEYCD